MSNNAPKTPAAQEILEGDLILLALCSMRPQQCRSRIQHMVSHRPSPARRLYTTPGKRRTEFITDASMKLDLRHGAPRDEPAECVQKYLAPAMQSDLMHFVEGPIH